MGCGASTQGQGHAASPAGGTKPGGNKGGAASGRGHRKPQDQKAKKSDASTRKAPRRIDWSCSDPEKWDFVKVQFDGRMSWATQPEFVEEQGPIEAGEEKLRNDRLSYVALFYQTGMLEWAPEYQKYSLIKRTKSGVGVKPDEQGLFTFIRAKYQALEQDVEVAPDEFTDGLMYKGEALAEAICPGRGLGVCDVPMIKVIGDADPNDISQGGVGDCWLLSALSALAEFDGAILRLFRKTPNLQSLPGQAFNRYTITLYDLKTWAPVEINIDERLCSNSQGSGLLGVAPTITGELWPCYIEKAVAIHCGGWDKVDGGQCTHAWRLLTGCQKQYTFRDLGEGFGCYGAFNPNTENWEALANSPHDGFKGLWPMAWPEVGGGGEIMMTLSHNEMFERLCCWDDNNFIMGCGTKAGSDSNSTEGIVDGHAYTILTCIDNAGGTEFDMVKVRNPWGKGEFTSGRWDDDGPGWQAFPKVKEACQPVAADDGIFWLDKEEFFQHFHTIYLCAKDMSDDKD